MLRIDNLGKRYGDRIVFQGLNHSFPPGGYALCELDSTGKSTLLGIVAGVIAPDAGDVWVEGHSLRQAPQLARARMAYVPGDCLAFPSQTGHGLLAQAASEKQLALDTAIFDLAEDLGLTPHLDKPFEQMSTGTRRKVFLVAAALGEPSVVIADGPSDGLDTRARAVLADLFHFWSQDRVVLFASHDPELVEACGAIPVEVAALR